MKLIAGSDRLKSRTKMADQDFDDAMKLFRKLTEIIYENESEKTIVKMAFNTFYPSYKSVKEKQCKSTPICTNQLASGKQAGGSFDRRGTEGLPQDRLGSPRPLPLILLTTNDTLLNLQVLH